MTAPEGIDEDLWHEAGQVAAAVHYAYGGTPGLEPPAVIVARALQAERDRSKAALAEAHDNAWPDGKRPNPVVGHLNGDFAVYGDEKSMKKVRAALHEFEAAMPARIQRIREQAAALESAEASLSEAQREIERLRGALDLAYPWLVGGALAALVGLYRIAAEVLPLPGAW